MRTLLITAVLLFSLPAYAGDREVNGRSFGGVGGISPGGNDTNYSLRQDGGGWFTDAFGRSVFSWGYLSQPGSGIGTYTDYDGIPGDDYSCCEAGIGSWGNGGGTGAGARGY